MNYLVIPKNIKSIEDASAALIVTGIPDQTNEQGSTLPGSHSLLHISPVMRSFRDRMYKRAGEQTLPLPPEISLSARRAATGKKI